jgi:hypothetical protein
MNSMSEHVKVAWSVPLSEDFDLKDFALGVLKIAKENLQYAKVIEAARDHGATALITCNDAFMDNQADPEAVETYYPGKLAATNAQECIMLMVSGPAIQTWTAEVPYERSGNKIEFGDTNEEIGGEVGFLEGWACEQPKLQ